MDLTQQDEPLSKKELKVKHRIEKVLAHQDLTLPKQLIEKITQELGIEVIDCAAALVLLSQNHIYPHTKKNHTPKKESEINQAVNQTSLKSSSVFLQPMQMPKMVRYRIEVGQKHHVTENEIKQIFIEEAGVDKKTIGKVEIRYHYTLIELPEGMPSDIYQLLMSVCLHEQELNIKRVKPYRERYMGHLHRKNNR